MQWSNNNKIIALKVQLLSRYLYWYTGKCSKGISLMDTFYGTYQQKEKYFILCDGSKNITAIQIWFIDPSLIFCLIKYKTNDFKMYFLILIFFNKFT